jgi:DNA-binding NarL/FixJ family response regulator
MEAGRPSGASAELEHPTVLVADDDASARRGVREALEAHGFVVAAETGDAGSTVGAAARLRPDVCLIEIELPGDGLRAIRRIAKESPKTLIVVLSHSNRSEDVVAAFTRGASGYLLKGIGGRPLATAIRAAYRGEPPLSRSLIPSLVSEIRRGSARRLVLPDGPVTLTPREWEVGELLREGLTTGEIAERLDVSPVTVRRHVGLLLRKLGAKGREEAVEILRVHGRR